MILTSRNQEKGKEALEELSGDIHFIQLDVADPESVDQARREVEDRFGLLDILVNNAGINYDRWQQAENANLEECRRTMEVNLFGPWRCSQAFLSGMRERGYGRIVNVSSGSGALSGMGSATPGYGISKPPLNGLAIKLAAGKGSDKKKKCLLIAEQPLSKIEKIFLSLLPEPALRQASEHKFCDH